MKYLIVNLLLYYFLSQKTVAILRKMENIKILVVDDDKGLRELLKRYLTGQDFIVFTVADAKEMDVFFENQTVDLVILDLMLPGEDGLSIARRLRANSNLPIIILSAKGEEVEKIIGLEMGADDYLAKPFNPRELLARIRAVLRRQGTQKTENSDNEVYHFGPYSLDINNYRFYCDNQEVSLTAGEFNLLHIFAKHAGKVLSRDQLMDLMKGYDRSPFDRSIDIRITRLRKKIESDPKDPQYIRTIWGMGYLFNLEMRNKIPT